MQESLLAGQVRVLESLAQGSPLEDVLTACLEYCEANSEDMLCSILLLDREGKHLRHGAAPSLPREYMDFIDGSGIGPAAGSCGTAAYRGEAVIVEDIATDPLWAGYRSAALPFGLRSCWSTPIFDKDRKVLGTFAIYYRKPGRPSEDHLLLIGSVTHIAGIAIACRRDEEEKRMIFERISDAFVALDASWRYIFVNARAGKLLGREPASLLGKRMWDEYPEIMEMNLRPTLERAMFEQQAVMLEEFFAPIGKWIEAHIYPSREGLSVYFCDVTNRKRAEEKQRQSEKLTAIGQLAGGIAHDFNNQLSVMLGYAGLLENRIADPELKRYAGSIVRAANRSGDLTRNLLSFSRQGRVENVPIDMHDLIGEVVELLTHSIDRRIAIRKEFEAGYAFVEGDPANMQNALLNLALNARDAMPEGGDLVFATRAAEIPALSTQGPSWKGEAWDPEDDLSDLTPGSYLRISVSDTGTGMTEEVRNRIFDPFFTTKPLGKGTGMGMASVFGTVKSHKGKILVDTRLGSGTAFHLFLPLAGTAKPPIGERRGAASTPPRGLQVLIVDDELQVRNLIADILKAGGHKVLDASGGRDGLRILEERWREIDLIILDMVMADIDGFETFQRIRRIHPDAKVIISSGYSPAGRIEALLEMGAKGFLQKPFVREELERMIAGAMD
jgi:PAS domain S-box-containing protein